MLNAARWVNVLVGIWLVVTAFLWEHTEAQFTNAWVVGLLSVGFALIAMSVTWVRYLEALLALWLFVSSWTLDTGAPATLWNNVLVSIAMLFLSLIAGPRPRVHETGAGEPLTTE